MGFDSDTVKFLDGKNFPDIKTAMASAREADTMVRARNVMNKPDAKNLKGWDGYTELGWSPDRQQYKIEPPKAGEGEFVNERGIKALEDAAHEARVAPWQAKAIADALHASDNKAVKDLQQRGATANLELTNALKSRLGSEYDQKVELGKRAFSFFKPDAITGAQMDQAMTSAGMVEMFIKIGEAMGEDKLVTGQDKGFGQKTPAAARAERLALENDPAWFAIFNNPRHPQNAAYAKQRADLFAIESRAG